MNQDPNFPRFGNQQPHQYGLHSFDAPPARKGLMAKVFGPGVAQRLSSPLFATGALLLCGVAFAGVIMAVYPGEETEIPVVKADTLAYKETPTDPGGMTIPNRDTTIFAAMNGEGTQEPAPVENLLAEEEPVDKLAAFARQVEESIEETKDVTGEAAEEVKQDLSTLAKAEVEETAPVTFQKIEQRMEAKPKPQEVAEVAPVAAPTPDAKPAAVRPVIVHKPGENPETLEFVKSVLDKKDGNVASASDVATNAAAIQPAAGNPSRGFTIEPGNHYVQLGSVKSLNGAEGEWGKLQNEFSAELGGAQHRVQAADLGERGTFFRIQAGPMSKDSASSICESIKAQKPGGCLVTQ